MSGATIGILDSDLIERIEMKRKQNGAKSEAKITAQPRLHQRAREIQSYGTVSYLPPLELEETVRLEMTAQLNQLLAETLTLRDLS